MFFVNAIGEIIRVDTFISILRYLVDNLRVRRLPTRLWFGRQTCAQRGFTLVEAVICLLIVVIAGIGTVSAITYTRLNLELEKQRLAALGYCRQAMEAIQSLDTATAGQKALVPFNSPSIEDLNAALTIEYYDITDAGKVDFSTSRTQPAINRPVYARVRVNWVPYGSNARPQEVTMSTIVTRGID